MVRTKRCNHFPKRCDDKISDDRVLELREIAFDHRIFRPRLIMYCFANPLCRNCRLLDFCGGLDFFHRSISGHLAAFLAICGEIFFRFCKVGNFILSPLLLYLTQRVSVYVIDLCYSITTIEIHTKDRQDSHSNMTHTACDRVSMMINPLSMSLPESDVTKSRPL